MSFSIGRNRSKPVLRSAGSLYLPSGGTCFPTDSYSCKNIVDGFVVTCYHPLLPQHSFHHCTHQPHLLLHFSLLSPSRRVHQICRGSCGLCIEVTGTKGSWLDVNMACAVMLERLRIGGMIVKSDVRERNEDKQKIEIMYD